MLHDITNPLTEALRMQQRALDIARELREHLGFEGLSVAINELGHIELKTSDNMHSVDIVGTWYDQDVLDISSLIIWIDNEPMSLGN